MTKIQCCKFCQEDFPKSYMVKDWVWDLAKLDKDDIVCIHCLEKKIKRKLIFSDFPKCKCNEMIFFGMYIERARWRAKKNLQKSA